MSFFVYCDYAASGKSLQFIEDYILREVLPVYGNTHTTTNVTSLQSTLYRHESRDIIRNAVHASEDDVVIFVGSGCTGAIHKLIHALDFASDPVAPVVLVGPYEHHSNLLPWREIGATVVRIAETKEGFIDLVDLESKLQLYQSVSPTAQLIGCFSAASNITGILADDIATTLILHQYGALAFWDYATAAPYVLMDMNPLFPANDQAVYKDAIFFSGHKFVGGIQTPGILVAKKKLFKNKIPVGGGGGGTVFFVSRKDHRYLKDTEMREEGGTGAIVESVRMGLAMQLKQNIGVPFIMAREEKITKMVLSFLQTMPEITLLGNSSQSVKRLPIFSLLVRHPRGAYLHHNFICAILNDVFGVQARGGCACAGPYAQDLLGIDDSLAIDYENILIEDNRLDRHHLRRHEEHSSFEMLRPGFSRISLPYFMSDNEVSFVLEALKMVATEGWKLLPQYTLNPETGEWKHHTNNVFRDRKWLGSIRYTDGKMVFPERKTSVQNTCPADFSECLKTARNTFNKARKMAQRFPLPDQRSMFTEETEKLRWFMLPSEAQDLLLGHSSRHVKQSVPFTPTMFCGSPRTSESSPSSSPNSSLARYNSLSSGLDNSLSARLRTSSSSSDMLNPKQHLSPVEIVSQRNRCYSLGSNPTPKFKRLRERQCSCSSQTELSDSDSRVSNDTNLPDGDIQAYVHEMTKEFVTEIKSELRGVIATVDNALSESSESLNVIEKRSSIPKVIKNMARNNSVPVITTTPCQNGIEEKVICRLSEFASEMKTEIHDMVSSVLASSSSLSDDNTDTIMEKESDSESDKENNLKHPNLSSTDSGINVKTDLPNRNLKKYKTECIVKMNCQKSVDFSVARWHCPPKPIWKPTIEAIREFDMIRDGDSIMVCLSGGKDSLSLLHTLHQYQYYASSKGINFTLGAATVDPGSSAYNPRPLIPYLKALGIQYLYEEQNILEQATSAECSSICSFCSRMKRGRLYATARANRYNVLALGQHLDDLAESFLMSTFHNGRLRSMKAHYSVKERDLRVIRPFVYVREKLLREFAENRKLPIIDENCPACFEAPKERHRTKQLLAQQEILFPKLFASLKSALRPLISFKQTGEESKAYQRMTIGRIEQSDKDFEEEPALF
ncbi:uncharacterized protein LOC126908518 isoform X2 [Daktulosphaira vitifoliae]|uniref:uncharacterized protein LOC126908518 isoform X2 n=1 Tax=Daktulosphaira vitifoliae TaxID=58002 RepID=UPI0021AA9320|nr:uncharacterized protein LOC126908518 isoform X2 [Daktulosphaira vitifoliae]